MSLLLQKLNPSGKKVIGMLQTHSNNVSIVTKRNAGSSLKNCDGLLTNDPKITLRISVADCIPLALFDPVTNSIGLIHVGWRGLYKGIIENSVSLMVKKYGIKPADITAEIGPHICQKHYEIKGDVALFFPEYKKAIKSIEDKLFLDLASIAKEQLVKLGIKNEKIVSDNHCTYEDASLPSYRRGDYQKRIYYFLHLPDSP
jgi:hypothetical protein